MNFDALPVWAFFVGSLVVIGVAFESGYRLGRPDPRRAVDHVKESPISVMSGAVLGLVAFMLAFTFGIVADRYDARKALVREEANAIRTTWFRTDFLPEPDRSEAVALLKRYVENHLVVARLNDVGGLRAVLAEAGRIQRRLWDMAVVNARRDMDSDVGSLYVESLNDLMSLQASRKTVVLQARIPSGIWIVLYVLVVLGMAGVGYQTAIAGSAKNSWGSWMLAFSFALVIALIASLDRPMSRFITISQQPLADVLAQMNAGPGPRSEPGNQPR